MKKRSNPSLKVFLKTVKYLFISFFVCFFVGVGFLYYKIEKEPVDLGFLLPKVESYLSPSKKLRLSADSIVLSASVSKLGLFHIQVDNLELKDSQNKTIIELPDVQFSYGVFQLLTFNFIPKNVFVQNAYLNLTLTKDGKFILEDEVQADEAEQNLEQNVQLSETDTFVVQNQKIIVNDVNRFLNRFLKLRKFTLKNSIVVLNDLKENKKIVFPNLNLTLKKRRFTQVDISGGGEVIVDKKPSVVLDLTANFNTLSKTMDFTLKFDHLKLDEIGRAIDIFKGFKVNLKGVISGELDFAYKSEGVKKLVKNLKFFVETISNGSVYLPHPLDITYPVKKITAQGIFGDQLEQLFIRPVNVELTTGISADVDIVVNGIGSFLDTLDVSNILTTINARLHHVPMKDVSKVWPAYLGPTAHAWVKENLIGGELTTALFTLYFTGGEITDLLGDVDFENVDVFYLRPLAPVRKVSGKVMLYPDKVEIFANKGKSGNVNLEIGNVYLTELLDDVSNAKIELKVNGPLNEMLTIIDSEPLDLISAYGIEPNKTKGSGFGEVELNFPLIENLKPADVQVQVNANIQNADITLSTINNTLKNAQLNLFVNNSGLKVDGKGDFLNSNIKLKWEEFFDVLEKQPYQSIYEISGVMNESMLVPYYKDISSFLTGDFLTTLNIKKKKSGEYLFDILADLKDSNLILYPITYGKMKGKEALLTSSFSYSPANGISSILFDYNAADNSNIKGSVVLKNAGFSMQLDNVNVPNSSFNGFVEYYEKELLKVKLDGTSWDLSGLKDMPNIKNSVPNPRMEQKMTPIGGTNLAEVFFDVKLDSLTLKKGLPFKQVSFKGYRNGSLWQNLFLFALAREAISINYTPQTGKLDGMVHDIGDFLARLDVSDQFEKGSALLKAQVLSNGGFSGDLTLKDMKLKQPGFVMQAVTILGIWDAISGNDLSFSTGDIPFDLTPNFTLFINDGVMYGTALGITFSGKASVSALDLSGSVIPAYVINSLPGRIPVIGHLFKDGKGGGLVGVKYEVKGTPGNPRVSFNPLSSIAPGILGRFFK